MHPIPTNTAFQITIFFDRRRYRYQVRKTGESGLLEHFTLYAKNGSWVLSSNRMVYRNRGVKHHDYAMKLVQGNCMYQSFIDDVVEAIKGKVKELEGKKGE